MEASSLPRARPLVLPRSRRLLGAFGDGRLVEEVRRGNDAAFEVIYDRHHRGILAFARHMLSSREEAEDAVQYVFTQAYNGMHRSDRELYLKAWLYTIARNRCLSMLRARREQPGELGELATAGLGEAVQQRVEVRELLEDMRELPEDQRAALVLSELGDLSHADVAQVLGCEPMKIKSLVFQARSALIESRTARETPCVEIREQLATLRGGALRRSALRKHLRVCPGCSEFREDVRRQRQLLAVALPVVPSVGLKASALSAVGLSSSSGGLAAGSGAAMGSGAAATSGTTAGTAAGLASGSLVKVAAVVVAAATAVGGGAALAPSPHAKKHRAAAPAPAVSYMARSAHRRHSSNASAAARQGTSPSAPVHRRASGHGRANVLHHHGHGLATALVTHRSSLLHGHPRTSPLAQPGPPQRTNRSGSRRSRTHSKPRGLHGR